MLAGRDGTWRVMAVTPTTLTLAPLAGATLPTSSSVVTAAAVPGPHGGLTVVHGGGNTALDVEVSGTTTAPTSGTLRCPGRRPRLGRRRLRDRPDVTVAGQAGVWRVTGFTNTPCPLADPFQGCGTGSRMQLQALSGQTAVGREPDRRPRRRGRPARGSRPWARWTSAPAPSPGPAGSWIADGFVVGMAAFISGLAGSWTVTGVTASTLTLRRVPP